MTGDRTDTDDRSCPVCGATRYARLFQVPFPYFSASRRRAFTLHERADVPTWVIAHCQNCSARYACPRPSAQSIAEFYSTQMEHDAWEQEYYVEIHPRAREGWDRFAAQLTALRGKPGSLLDIGCAAGWLLNAARARGWDVLGVEATPKFRRYAANVLHLPVILGTIADLNAATMGPFDVVTMTDVVEHLQDPVAELTKVRELIAPGGFLVLTTCDINSLCARFYGLTWRQIVPSHTVYWTKRSMAYALQRAGFRVEHVSEPRYWDPDIRVERRNHVRELAKLAARVALRLSYANLTQRFPALQRLPSLATHGHLDHTTLMLKIGDQPVLGDVMLVVARPIWPHSTRTLSETSPARAPTPSPPSPTRYSHAPGRGARRSGSRDRLTGG